MVDLEAFGHHANGRTRSIRQPLDCEKRLVLLRLNSERSRRVFTELQKTPDFITEIRQGLEINFTLHRCFTSYHDINKTEITYPQRLKDFYKASQEVVTPV
jgi:hypothetical protein